MSPATMVAPIDGSPSVVVDGTEVIAEYQGATNGAPMEQGALPLRPGLHATEVETFRLPAKPAAGGVLPLLYGDADGTTFTWRLPTEDTGPEAAVLKGYVAQQLAPS